MRRRWPVWLSVFLLMVGFFPNLILASKAFADSTQEAKQQVIESNQLNVRSVATRSDEKIVWDIYYRSLASTDQQQRLKVQVTDSAGQVVAPTQKEGWTTDESSWFVSAFHDSDEGVLSFETSGSVTSIQLAIQADSQSNESGESVITENSLPDISAKNYTITAPEKVVEATTVSSEATSQSSSEQQVTQSMTEVSTETAKSYVTQEKESTNESTTASSKAKDKESSKVQTDRASVANFSAKSVLDSIQSLSATTSYSNVSPEYTNDGTGIYPKSYWSPTGNTTVRNHQGKLYGATGWDGVTTWKGDASNKTNSYIEYGGTGENADFAIRKYAKETSNPGLYDVYLNVRGNEIKDIKPIDIVLVIDMSGSMNTQSGGSTMTRADAVRQGVRSFLQHIIDAGISKYVNVGFVGYSSEGSDYVNLIKEDIASVNNQAHVNTINTLLNRTFLGGTFTQQGIRTAADMLSNYSSQNQKMMILMTDGVPTFSYKVTAAVTKNGLPYGTSFSNTLDEPAFTSQLWTTSKRSRTPNPYTINGLSIKDTWAATLGEADIIMNQKNIQLHTLGIQLAKDVGYTNNSANTYLSVEEVRKRMSLMASDGHYLDANTADDVKTYLENQAANVVSAFNTVNQGSISDPIGAQFNANGSTVNVKSVGSTAIATLPNATLTNNQLSVSNINLGKGQEIQLHYQVRMNTESSTFVPETWYPMNGKTTFTPNITNPNNQVEFGVPSAKAAGVKLAIEKRWQEYDNDQSQRPATLDFSIERSTTTASGAWTKGYVRLSAPDWSKQNITRVASNTGGSETIWLPKFNNQGKDFTYKITEVTVPEGYEASSNADGSIWTNSKIFNPLGLKITKVSSVNQSPLKGAVFKLTGGSLPADGVVLVDQQDGTYSLPTNTKLQLDSTYKLTEVSPPSGHEISTTTWQVTVSKTGEVTINDTKDGVQLKDHTILYTITNEFKKITFRTEKYRTGTTEQLSGAKFTLKQYEENWQGIGTIVGSQNDLLGNEVSSFKSLLSGYYSIQETTVPQGYLADDTSYKFRVTLDGNVLDESGKTLSATTLPTKNGWYTKQTSQESVLVFAKYNQLRLFTVSILKEDYQTKTKLAGATFGLAAKDNPDAQLATLETDANGQGVFKQADGSSGESFGLAAGEYVIKELAAPEGYVLLPDSFDLTIKEDGTITLSYQGGDVTDALAEVALTNDGTNTIQLTLANTKKGELPATGGKGKAMFVLGSSGIFGLASLLGVYYIYRNRKGER
ncbi:SpaA isopeptide-forming pilin-related protein [Enterococcus italicus]|uniref:SpaA isopeptide-forming pilin-related protein n=1 Tax=Enterococcus italicus TaxID=246144 RepID=UPI002072D71C|nr:SpaA isopeptide-forming pilin-related protein [Enterococcus italicus]MCM6932249.1 SpaA isopeptide-forming pilin-related protein [Enterococcus italicus]